MVANKNSSMKRVVEYIKNMLLKRVTCIYKNSVVKRVVESNKSRK